jgi:multiple sugar transport system substrate-binding protein
MHSITDRVRLASAIIFVCAGACARSDARILRVWSHHGREAEHRAMQSIAESFVRPVELTFFPDPQYAEKIAVAAAARDLPDVLEIDGPQVPKLADAGLLEPLDGFLSAAERGDFLPTIIAQGTFAGHLYALGAFESALALYYDRALFDRAGIDAPPVGGSWSWDQLTSAARALKETGVVPLALHMNEAEDEWFVYAFAPILWSAGGELISDDGTRVAGVLDSEVNVLALKRWQRLFVDGLAEADPVDPDPFGHGRAAMDWSGHWMARAHLEAKGERLGAMIIPRAGTRVVVPSGSWCWAIVAGTSSLDEARAWIAHVTDPILGIRPMVVANGAVPGRHSAFAGLDWLSRPPYVLFREQLARDARPRPRTPFYATLARRFAAMLRDVAHGAEVSARLHETAASIQREIDRRKR